MIQERYKNSALLKIIQTYLSMSEEEINALEGSQKSVAEELINYYNTTICIK